jgi:membrane-associated phospholipid phosphatase
MIALAVLVAATAVAGVAALLVNFTQRGRHRRAQPLDTERQEVWLIAQAPPRLRGALRYADRRVVGGVAMAVGLSTVFAVALFLGWMLDTIDAEGGFARWDQAAAQWGADHATPTSTRVLEIVTELGATGRLLLVMAVAAVIAYLRRRSTREAVYLAAVGVGVLLLNNGLKLAVGRERPDLHQLAGHSGSSFPSGHTAAAAACWAALALVVARRRSRRDRALFAAGAATITAGVAASRVLLGVHWLTDVIAGAVTGWGWFLFVTFVFGGRLLRFGEPVERAARGNPPAGVAHRSPLGGPGRSPVGSLPTRRGESHRGGSTR